MTLREQVAQALAAELGFDEWDAGAYLVAADAAIGVVLAALATQIEALPVTGATYFGRRVPGSMDLLAREAVLALVRGAGGAA